MGTFPGYTGVVFASSGAVMSIQSPLPLFGFDALCAPAIPAASTITKTTLIAPRTIASRKTTKGVPAGTPRISTSILPVRLGKTGQLAATLSLIVSATYKLFSISTS
jgi:hypothetical protein